MTLSKQPVSSFGAELQATLRKGAQQAFEITFETPQLAIRFQHRINALRAAMKREKHSDWEQLYRCGVYIDKADPKKLIIAPRDSEFRKALAAAGITNLEPLPTTEVTITSGPSDNFLAEIVRETAIPKLSDIPPEGENKV